MSKYWVAALALLPIAALSQPMPLGYCWPEGWRMMGGAGYGWMFPLAIFGLMVLVVAFAALRGPWSRHHWHGTVNRSALALLGERFARGEISREEFEEKKDILSRRT
jgi:putative membrane protein